MIVWITVRQLVAKFVFSVGNLLFSQVPALQPDTDKQW